MANIVVAGSSNTDMVIRTSKFPVPGETILGGSFFMFSGGKGANQAVAAARMGGEVVFIAKTGNDIFGQRAIAELQKEGIATGYITTEANLASGTALILVDEKGENEIVVAPGANNTLMPKDITAAANEINNNSILLLQLEIPLDTVVFAAAMAAKTRARVILNPAPACSLPSAIFPCLYLITPNETEAFLLTGVKVTDRHSAALAANVLLQWGVKNVIVTLGAQGAYFSNGALEMLVAAPVVQAVDSTAAGDTFNGVLATLLARDSQWETAIATACKAASISVTRMGAQASMPYLHELAGTI